MPYGSTPRESREVMALGELDKVEKMPLKLQSVQYNFPAKNVMPYGSLRFVLRSLLFEPSVLELSSLFRV